MTARENLLVGLLTGVWKKHGEPDRGVSGTALIDAYRTEVLAEAADAQTAVYRERAHLVALLAAQYPSHIGHTDPASPDWAVVTIEAPTGQLCWHISQADMDLFGNVQPTNRICRGWDGHSTEEKYERIRDLTASLSPAVPPCRCGHDRARHDPGQCRDCDGDSENTWQHPYTPAR